MGRNYAQLLAWSAIAGVFWIAGGLAHGDARLAFWIVALAVDYGAPMHGFCFPGPGARTRGTGRSPADTSPSAAGSCS
jgi:low temperature requirement protein LtrA